jgi:hypothetical protein
MLRSSAERPLPREINYVDWDRSRALAYRSSYVWASALSRLFQKLLESCRLFGQNQVFVQILHIYLALLSRKSPDVIESIDI